MKQLLSFAAAAACIAPATAQAQSVASATVIFSNGSNNCINVSSKAVTLYLTSITIEKKNGWLTQTEAVGAQADLTLISNAIGRSVTFPRAREVSTNSVGGKIVRANLNFPILAQYEFDDESKMTALDIPVILLRRKGDSDIAKYTKTMIQVTKQLSGVIPGNPFAQGVDVAGQLAGAFLDTAKTQNAENAMRPSFQISHTLSRASTCNENDLVDGIQAKISDISGTKPAPGVIAVGDRNKYCFYRTGSLGDPDISYSSKPTSGVCETAPPSGVTVLQNPQVIYLVHAVTPNVLAAGRKSLEQHSSMKSLVPTAPNLQALRKIDPVFRDSELSRALEICAGIGLNAEKCLNMAGQ